MIVGARVAGASTGMLLARAGLRVLLLDRDRFPSDTLSSHQIQLPGVACLHRWGLLDRVIASNAPPTPSALLVPGAVRLAGRYPAYQGVDAMISPRRSVLDATLVAAAREAGAEVIEGFAVDGLRYDGDRVTGVRGAHKGGLPAEFTCRLVIGADGKHSRVAAWAGARSYRVRPSRTAMFYTYLSGLGGQRGEMYVQPDHVAGYWPTNDGLTVAFLAVPLSRFVELRSDLDRHFRDMARAHLGERARGLQRADRFRGTPDLPNGLRVPYGRGWALVGDAGLVMDPITGQGIGQGDCVVGWQCFDLLVCGLSGLCGGSWSG